MPDILAEMYEVKDRMLNVPPVAELHKIDDPEVRTKATKKATEYLAACSLDEILELTDRVQALYDFAITKRGRNLISFDDVDVFALAAVRALHAEQGDASEQAQKRIKALEHLRKMDGRARYHGVDLPPLASELAHIPEVVKSELLNG